MASLDILILTQKNCAFCEVAKKLFDQLAREYPLAISTLGLETRDGQEMARQGSVLFSPGIFIDGDAFSYGRPSEGKIRREIERRFAQRPRQDAKRRD